MTDHDWDNPITCEFVGAQSPERPNGENTVSSTAIPEKLIRTVTDVYLIALRQGDLHAALGLMTQLANTYGLVAVRGLAAELAMNLHTHCPSRFRTAFGGANLSALAPRRTTTRSPPLMSPPRPTASWGAGRLQLPTWRTPKSRCASRKPSAMPFRRHSMPLLGTAVRLRPLSWAR
ncbi:hypothetical protein FE633_17075 [Streptomyces montanus]|uniref:Uncharacterized protein n=1 Tax=Streptomyces montanus TaxID=2580423 RepID=A0A5R9FVF2_9ACTN|nr:hypothetical protein FE633_17075 [Streptomyces montanus]